MASPPPEPEVMPFPQEVGLFERFEGRQRFVLVTLGKHRIALAPYKARELAEALVRQSDAIVRGVPRG